MLGYSGACNSIRFRLSISTEFTSMSGLPRQLRRWLSLLGIIAGLLYSGENQSVYASCGDYLAHADTVGEQYSSVESPMNGVEHPSQHTPCRGPNCRSAPPAPMSPAPVRVDFSRVDLMLIEVVDSYGDAGDKGYLTSLEAIEIPLPPTSRLERPPRSRS